MLLGFLAPKLGKIDLKVLPLEFVNWCTSLTTNKQFEASAGTIRAVPDTVKKVPGLAPVLITKMLFSTTSSQNRLS